MAQIKKQIIHHYGKNTEQFKLSYISGGNAKMVQLLCKNNLAVSYKIKNIPIIWLCNTLLGVYPWEMKTYVHIKICMEVCRSFIHNCSYWKPKCPPTAIGENKLWYTYTMEYYSTINRNENETTWMKLKFITFSKRIWTQKATYCMIPFTWHSKEKVKLHWLHGLVGGEGDDYIEAWGNFLALWKCFISWCWWWIHDCTLWLNCVQFNCIQNFVYCII